MTPQEGYIILRRISKGLLLYGNEEIILRNVQKGFIILCFVVYCSVFTEEDCCLLFAEWLSVSFRVLVYDKEVQDTFAMNMCSVAKILHVEQVHS